MITGAVTHITAAFCALGFLAAPAAATQVPAPASPASRTGAGGSVTLRAGAHAAALVTHANPAIVGKSETEAYLVHPLLLARLGAWTDRVTLMATIDLEGWTLRNGELAIGNAGEGYVDRRHPHTFLHELVLSASAPVGPLEASLSVGRGFAPFGTDDPMTRPAHRYPVNHHLSQILERAQIVAAIGVPPLPKSPVLLEASAFNGDEPTTPGAWPSLDRLGDSWAVRLTARPAATLEAQVSHAAVRSPEHPGGAGLDHAKWSAALRWADRRRYALAEWARTSEGGGAFVFHSTLFEVARSSGRHRPYARFERTERPEEERTGVFRSRRPLRDNGILGITRWTLWTAGYRHHIRTSQRAVFEPFSELTLGSVAMVGGGVFDAEGYYGGRSFAAAAIGMRLSRGLDDHRMGRYTH